MAGFGRSLPRRIPSSFAFTQEPRPPTGLSGFLLARTFLPKFYPPDLIRGHRADVLWLRRAKPTTGNPICPLITRRVGFKSCPRYWKRPETGLVLRSGVAQPPQSTATRSVQSLNRVNVARKGDFSPPRPMMRTWGKGSGVSSAAPCLTGRGRVRRMRGMGSTGNRCRWAFATCSSPGEKATIHATTMSV